MGAGDTASLGQPDNMRLVYRLRSRLSGVPSPPVTSRYQGPTWEYRRARVFERLGINLVIDVGANSGQYATEIRAENYGGRIVSFEPASDPFASLSERCEHDPLWTAQKFAIGSEPGSATLNIAANEGKSSSLLPQKDYEFGTTTAMRYVGTETVVVTTLAALAGTLLNGEDRVYLKVDVQGAELSVLEGADTFLSSVLAVELELALFPLYENHSDWRAMCDRMAELGFVFFAVDPGYTDWESGRLVEMDGMFLREQFAELR